MAGARLHFLNSREVASPGAYRYHEMAGAPPEAVRVVRENGQLWVRFAKRGSTRVAELSGAFEGPLDEEADGSTPSDTSKLRGS